MQKTNVCLFLIIAFFPLYVLIGQNQKKAPISEVLDNISRQHQVNFNYQSGLLKDVKVFPIEKNLSLPEKIQNLEQQTNLHFNKISNAVYTIIRVTRFCGYLKNELSEPISNATVQSENSNAVTDVNGFFEIEVQSLKERISIRHIGFRTIESKAETFNINKCDTITMVEQQEAIETVLLESYLVKGIDKTNDWTTSIDYKKFSLLPGLIESDVLQTVQALPSILSVDETVSNINIRGGSHDQNLILWDGIKMYQTGHFFGLISSFNPHMTQTASVINNGTKASLTDGVSGTIFMKTDDDINSEFKGVFGINFLNAELFSDIPIGKKSSLQVASRYSLNEFFNTPTYNEYFNRVTQATEAQNNNTLVTNSDQKFDFYDVSLRWLYQPTKKDAIRFNFIVMSNDLSFDETATVNNSLSSRESSISQNSFAFGLDYKRQWSKDFFSNLSIYETDYKLRSINANVLEGQSFLQENIVSETSVKLQNVLIKNNFNFELGYQFTETEITNLNDIDLPRFVRRDEEVLRAHAAYGQIKYDDKINGFSIRGGLRANYIPKFERVLAEPRLNIRKSIGNHFEIEALGEFKHQNTSQIINFQNDFLGIERRRWQLTNNDSIPILQSKQASVGLLYKNKGWLLDGKVYYKTVDGITSQSQGFTTKYEFARARGNYDAYGFEFLLRKKFKNFNSWMSYAYIDNKYNFNTLEDVEFSSNFDISHSITFGTTYSDDSWNISAGANYRTGKPTSKPVLGAEIVNNEINFGVANINHLKSYFRVDASAVYKFKINQKLNVEVGASIWNIFDRENAINNYYRINSSNTVNVFSRFSLGTTSNVVFRINF